MTSVWEFKPKPKHELVEFLSTQLNINVILARLLVQRNVTTYEEAKTFFRPSIRHLNDPFLMKDMDRAVNRLTEAIANNEKILIYGDYDVDGTTAVALCYDFLKKHYEHVETYIPDRYGEGYGISKLGIEFARDHGFKLIISLDCGIKAIDKVNMANSFGIDFIICDHHNPGLEIPKAVAVLDPKRKDCPYPFKELSGCGVGFKLMQAFAIQNGIEETMVLDYLDLVAVSIASDIVPIVGENRALAYFGLKILNKNPRTGLRELIKIAGFSGKLDIGNVVFGIGPRINAAGRIGHARAAVELLTTNDDLMAREWAQRINQQNSKRKDYDNSITEEVLSIIGSDKQLLNRKSTVVYSKNWHKGVIGIVASRCIETYYRPTIILTESNNMLTGSARSVKGFDVYEAISECSELLEQYGGHKYAAGLTMTPENFGPFQKKFEDVVASSIKKEQLQPTLEIDTEISLEQISTNFVNILKQMGPFGPGNMTPVFVAYNCFSTGKTRLMKEKHIRFNVSQKGSEKVIVAVGFGFGKYFELINSGCNFSLAFTVEENTFKGNTTLQLLIKDIKMD